MSLKYFLKQIVSRNKFLERSARFILSLYEARVGTEKARLMHKESIASEPTIGKGFLAIRGRWPSLHCTSVDNPIFIFSAGWRSGSTLLQRLIMSKDPILIWGEPFSEAGLIQHLSLPFRCITPSWPPDKWFVSNFEIENLSQTWVANLYPEIEDLIQANVQYMNRLFSDPAKKFGFQRWGIKDVRLTIEHAYFLKYLFPKAKFLFLYRNPYDAYKSYRSKRFWYKEWPDYPVFTPAQFAEHWFELLSGYLKGFKYVKGRMIRYEDIIQQNIDFDELQEYLDIEIDRKVLKKRIGSSSSSLSLNAIPMNELKIVKSKVEPLASDLGFFITD